MKNSILVLIFSAFLYSCGSTPEIKNFNKESWAQDVKGCKNQRVELVKVLFNNKESVKGLSDKDLFKILGKPDLQRYYERGKKSYLYFYEPGNQCENNETNSLGKRIVFEVNALGKVVLITEEIH